MLIDELPTKRKTASLLFWVFIFGLTFFLLGILLIDRTRAQELIVEKPILGGTGIDGLLTVEEYYAKSETEELTKKDFIAFQEQVVSLLLKCKN